MIAILTNSVEHALRAQAKNIDVYSRSTRKGVFMSGREFMIVNCPEQLNGCRLDDYIVEGAPLPELVELARARMLP